MRMEWITILKMENVLENVAEMEIDNYGELIEETYKEDGEYEEAIYKLDKSRYLIQVYNNYGSSTVDLIISKLISF